jgi:hypothetical protein
MRGRPSAIRREVAERKESGAHPIRAQLETFMRGETPRSEAPDVVRHLLTGCPECLQVTRQLWKLGEPSNNSFDGLVTSRQRRGRNEPGLI